MRSREFWRECDIPPKLSLILLVGGGLVAAILFLAGCEGRVPERREYLGWFTPRWSANGGVAFTYDEHAIEAAPLPLTNATGTALVVSDSVSCCLLRAGESREWTPGGGPVEITAPEGYDLRDAAEATVSDTGPLPDPRLGG